MPHSVTSSSVHLHQRILTGACSGSTVRGSRLGGGPKLQGGLCKLEMEACAFVGFEAFKPETVQSTGNHWTNGPFVQCFFDVVC